MSAETLYLEAQKASIVDFTPELLKDNPVWKDLISCIISVIEANVEAPIDELSTLRHLNLSTDKPILAKTINLLGVTVTQNLLNLTQSRLLKLCNQVAFYPNYSGTNYFIYFLEVILNGVIELTPLYTKDYVIFEPNKSGLDLNIQGGEWYLTTHVNLKLTLNSKKDYLIFADPIIVDSIRELVYKFSPVTMVIKDFKIEVAGHAPILDLMPNEFALTSVVNAALSTVITSSQVTVTGLESNYNLTVTATGGSVDAGTTDLSGSFSSQKVVTTSSDGTFVLAVRGTSASINDSSTLVSVSFNGGFTKIFSITTRSANAPTSS